MLSPILITLVYNRYYCSQFIGGKRSKRLCPTYIVSKWWSLIQSIYFPIQIPTAHIPRVLRLLYFIYKFEQYNYLMCNVSISWEQKYFNLKLLFILWGLQREAMTLICTSYSKVFMMSLFASGPLRYPPFSSKFLLFIFNLHI